MKGNDYFANRLGIRLPIVAAPMAGGPTTVALAAAVADAGGLGVLAGGYRTPAELDADIASMRTATSAPFGVNLLVPPVSPQSCPDELFASAVAALAPYADELGVPWPPQSASPDRSAQEFAAQMDVVLSHPVALFSFTFGFPSPAFLKALRHAGTLLAGTATTAAEARALADAGVDAVCAQGSEAGGHRGTFLGEPLSALTRLGTLVPDVVASAGLPVIAAGGIMDGVDIATSLADGACAAQLGTAFMLCPEAGTSVPYRRAVAAADGKDTVVTAAVTGKAARGIANRLVRELADKTMPPYPITNSLTRPLRQAAARQGNAEFLSLWAGEGVGRTRELPAADLVRALERETASAIDGHGKEEAAR